MEYLYATIMLAGCLWSLWKMHSSNYGQFHLVGVIGIFSIGYYVLPIFFKELSGLDRIDDEKVSVALLMCVVFFICIIFGNTIFMRNENSIPVHELSFGCIDVFFTKNQSIIFIISYIVWVAYFFSSVSTSYASEDFDAFFLERSSFDGLLATISGYALGAMALILSANIKNKNSASFLMMLLYGSTIVFELTTAQRLSVITPVFTLVAALSVMGASRFSVKLLFGGVLLLVIVSPVMVFLREFQAGGASGADKISSASSSFSFENNGFFGQLILSIMQRADLIEVITYLKSYIDSRGSVGIEYYLSVALSFVPKVFYASKPYVLSDDGTLFGSLSVIAWGLLQGSAVGSLSAFGAISAYWEGGWFWLPFNGILVGIMYGILYKTLGAGSPVAKVFYCSLFVTACVKNVPPSFFELVSYLSASINIIILTYLLSKILYLFNRAR